ncbi:MAG: hypothetical protein WD810_03075 [Solirubrobacterales bacterium]
MRLRRSALLAALLLAALAAGPTAVAAADLESLRPLGLRVAGGEAAWHADNDFRLDWDRSPDAIQVAPATAVAYLVRDADGDVVVPAARIPWEVRQFDHIHVPSDPGRYRAEVWLEHGVDQGPRVGATLLFDDARPGSARPVALATWIPGGAATLRIEAPIGPQPVSGIRGYAVSVDREPEGSPCAGPNRCGEAETNLRSGAAAASISLGTLPEGLNFAHVVAVSGSGMRSRVAEDVSVRVDASLPDVALTGPPSGWADGPVRILATATDRHSGMASSGPAGPFTAIAVDGGVPAVSPGPSAAVTVTGDGTHRVAYYARDAAGNVGDGQAGSAPPESVVVRIDGTPPQVAFVVARDPADPERIEAVVTDQVSGPGTAKGTISVRAAGTHRQFERLPTSVSEGRLVARWDSDASPAGSYEFSATGYDAAGNAGGGNRRTDGARMVLANPLKRETAISFGFGARQLSTKSIGYGNGVRVGGRLISPSGSPLAGLPVDLIETFDAGARIAARTTTVVTGEDGTFLARLAPGPSRRIEARFAGNRVLTRASGGQVQLAVPTVVRMHASAETASVGGAPVVFSGRIGQLGARIPSSGRPVQLQFRLPGAPWSEFRTVQTDRRGRFHYAYSFSDDDSRGVHFQFRAYAPAQEGWPYAPGASRPVAITGR